MPTFRTVLALLAAGVSLAPAWGQPKKQKLPDFDVRDLASAEARTQLLLERRRASVVAFVTAAEGSRIVTNRHGLPKVLRRDGQPLSAPSTQAPEEIAKSFLRAHAGIFPFAASEVDRLRLTIKDVTADATFLVFTQTLDGVDVFNGQIKFTLSGAGEVVQAGVGDVIAELSLKTRSRLSPLEAIEAAYDSIGAKPRGVPFSPITAELSIFPMDATNARLAYRILLEADSQSWYEILIDAENGDLLFRHSLYVHAASARVWLQSPMQGTRQLVTLPSGWLPANGTATTGNNADAYLDADGDDQPDAVNSGGMMNGRPFSAAQVFDYPFGDGLSGMDPRNFNAAAVTNLFYHLNTAHDYYYSLGFTEAAGNFQTDKFGKGSGADAVLGEAHNPLLIDGAAFAPTPVGIAPKIRMGLFTRGTATLTDDLDSDYDGQVVIHEYGHGVSNRLVGAGTSTSCLAKIQSGAMGEGWSDYFSISYYNNPIEGAYLTQNAVSGVRRQSYEGYTFTYEDIGNGATGYEVHDDGEIWGATLWDLRKSLGQAVADKLVMNGLKSTPCNPSMTDARDAILSADVAGAGGNRAKLWQVFAKHGLGYSAAGVDGTALTGTVYTAAYDQPPDLQALKNPAITSTPPAAVPGLGDAYSYTITASNPNAGLLNFALTSGPAGLTLDAVSGLMRWTAGFVGQRVKLTVTDGLGGKVTHGFLLPVVTTLKDGASVTVAGAGNSDGYAVFTAPANAAALQVKLRGGSGDADLVVLDPSGRPSISARDGNTETLSFGAPAAGRWVIDVNGFAGYAGVSLTAGVVTPTLLSGHATVTGLNGVISDETFFRVTIPAGTTNFTVSTSGGTGDVDLLVRKDKLALCQPSDLVFEPCSFDQVSAHAGNAETISVTGPGAGDWYIDLIGFDNYSGVTLTTSITVPPALAISATTLSFDAVEAGPAPPSKNLALSNPAGTVYIWTAKASTSTGDPAWLQVSPLTGTGDATLTATVNPAGLKAGTYQGTITVTSAGLAGSPQSVAVTLNVSAKAPPGPAAMTIVSGANQSGAPGTALGNPLVVQVNDSGGSAVAGAAVTFTATNASVNPSSARSDAAGRASTMVTLGANPGAAAITASVAGLAPVTFLETVTAPGPPVIGQVVDTAGLQPVVSPGGWFSVRGSGLASITRGWTDADFNGSSLPKALDGVGVSVDGVDASVYFVSPSEIRAIAPATVNAGAVDVVVTNSQGLRSTSQVVVAPLAPALFPLLAENRKYAVALHEDGTLAGKAGSPIRAGEKLLLLGTGFGLSDPPVPADQLLDGYPGLAMSDQLKIRVGEAEAPVNGAVMLGNGLPDLKDVAAGWPDGDRGLPGLWAITVTVPDLAAGDYLLTTEFGVAGMGQSVYLSIGPGGANGAGQK